MWGLSYFGVALSFMQALVQTMFAVITTFRLVRLATYQDMKNDTTPVAINTTPVMIPALCSHLCQLSFTIPL